MFAYLCYYANIGFGFLTLAVGRALYLQVTMSLRAAPLGYWRETLPGESVSFNPILLVAFTPIDPW